MRLKTWDRFSVYINLINYARSNGNNSYSKTQITFSKIFYKSATHAVRWSKWIRVKTAMKKWWICFLCSLSWEGGENEKMQRKNIGKSLDSGSDLFFNWGSNMVNIIALFKNCVEVTENIFLGNVYYNCYFCLKSQPDNMITTIASSRVHIFFFITFLCFVI